MSSPAQDLGYERPARKCEAGQTLAGLILTVAVVLLALLGAWALLEGWRP